MATITSIRRNVKDGGRCSVFVDEVFLAACPIDVATALGLRKGLEMTDELERSLRKEDRRIVLRQKTYHFATYKPRTEYQVCDFLRKKEAAPEEVESVMKWLREFRLIDDRLFAERFLEAARIQKPLSRSMAKLTLKRKGVPDDVVDEALDQHYTSEDAFNAARHVTIKKLRMLQPSSDKIRDEKLTRFLQYRGFGWDVIKAIVEQVRSGTLATVLCSILGFAISCANVNAQGITTCRRVRLPETINSFQTTTQPLMSPDGVLYLDRKMHPDNSDGGVKDPDDVWTSRINANGMWIDPTPASFTTFTRPDLVFSFTSDGLAALVVGQYRVVNGMNIPTFAIITRRSRRDLFSSVSPVIIPGVTSLGRNFYGAMSDDRNTIILALERSAGLGGLDLYVTHRCKEFWSAPVNLGSDVNTSAFEGAPWLAADGQTLYFASSGRDDRKGKADIYISRRREGSWTSWTTPRNLGSCVNTIEDETAFSLIGRGDSALIHSWDAESDRPGIYMVELPEDVRPLPSCSFTGRVVDAVSGAAIASAETVCQDSISLCQFVIPIDTSEKTFKIALPAHRRYHIESRAAMYVTHRQVIGIRTLDSTTSLRVTTQMFHTQRPLASVYFDRGAAQLSAENIELLKELVKRYDLRQISFDVVGYTDMLGTIPANKTLSAQRAESVVEELKTIGLHEDRIRAIGRGIENPGTLLSLKENPQSRRVDIFPVDRLRR
ncbi:MAG: RecX family transcriptional regulator [Candidatus Kapabacteria bacterium]|nr:RecX family transcriptional regulator [Candidatus Kapabacteria bacterium]